MTTDHRSEWARRHLEMSIEIKQQVIESCIPSVIAACDLIVAAFRNMNKLMICGNGGSAADSQHMAAEFTNRLSEEYERPGLPALALTTDTSFLTACANDAGFEYIFARQVQSLGALGDVVLGISTSGNSENVIRAVEYAKANGMGAISLAGNGGKLLEIADVCIKVPSSITAVVQETHLAIEHIVCHLVERDLFGYEEDQR